ncbi:hypothetical protein DL770_003001 [Monosporascus sp. CRB-9-2]|nr:hypothetical protein DL770_003001 [Monosporascus sp. CRB-9-2]
MVVHNVGVPGVPAAPQRRGPASPSPQTTTPGTLCWPTGSGRGAVESAAVSGASGRSSPQRGHLVPPELGICAYALHLGSVRTRLQNHARALGSEWMA